MQQIADWLEKLGMSEYTQRFAENRIDDGIAIARQCVYAQFAFLGRLLGSDWAVMGLLKTWLTQLECDPNALICRFGALEESAPTLIARRLAF